MVAGRPIAHHVWAGNTVDHKTVQEVVRDLHQRFQFHRIVFVGDRGMVTDQNIMKSLSTVHLVTLRLEGRDARCGVNGGSPDERRVLKALKPSELRPPEPPKGEECVM